MTKKQKIIVSTTGIFLVLLILVGLTYAYFLTRIKGNTNEKSISVSTANLILEYADIEDIVVGGENVEPGTTWTKKFSATNKGSKKVEYGVALENVLNTLERTKDLVYTLNCTSSLGTDCNKVETETEFPVIGTILITNNIEPEEVQSYELIVSYKEQNEDQSVDMNKKIYAKTNIVDPKTFGALGSGTLASKIIDSAKKASESNDSIRTTFGSKVINFTGPSETYYEDTFTTNEEMTNPSITYWLVSNNLNDVKNGVSITTINDAVGKYVYNTTSNWIKYLESYDSTTTIATFKNLKQSYEKVLNNTLDDYGTSYYFRGNVVDNYVFFANKIWRIVRINGDGSVRLILDDVVGDEMEFNQSPIKDNAYTGYMYGLTGVTTNVERCLTLSEENEVIDKISDASYNTKTNCEKNGGVWTTTAYEATHANVKDSNIKIKVDEWYENNLKDNFSKYLTDALFCNDKSVLDPNSVGFNDIATKYSPSYRITSANLVTPTLKCAENFSVKSSRLTTTTDSINDVSLDAKLKYPIGLMSADEVFFAGGARVIKNTNFYLVDSNISSNWWLMTTYIKPNAKGNVINYIFDVSNNLIKATYVYNQVAKIRPVVNLRNDVLFVDGNGTYDNMYKIKLPTE